MEKTYQEILKTGYDKLMKNVAWNCEYFDEHFDGDKGLIPGTTADIKAWEKARDELLAAHPDSEWWEESARDAVWTCVFPDASRGWEERTRNTLDLWWLRTLLRQMTANRELPFERLLDVAKHFFRNLRLMEKADMSGDEKTGDEIEEEIEADQEMLKVLGCYGGYFWRGDDDKHGWASDVTIEVGRWKLYVERDRYEVDGEPLFHCWLYECFPRWLHRSHVIYHWDTRGWEA